MFSFPINSVPNTRQARGMNTYDMIELFDSTDQGGMDTDRRERQRERDVGIIWIKIYVDLALEAWSQRRERVCVWLWVWVCAFTSPF